MSQVPFIRRILEIATLFGAASSTPDKTVSASSLVRETRSLLGETG